MFLRVYLHDLSPPRGTRDPLLLITVTQSKQAHPMPTQIDALPKCLKPGLSKINMRYQYLFIPSALLGNAFAQAPTLSLQNNRVEQAGCAPKIHFCSNTSWRDCSAPISSPNHCVTTDRLNDVESIAIDLGLCCVFYSDENCNSMIWNTKNDGTWYPGLERVNDGFRNQVGSYMCKNGTLSSDCPAAGTATGIASGSTAAPTASQSTI
ncbi:hypothetical protein GMOD_00004943 [Pyrenophora seminiperda CCB06]|uniref:Uncharacterized protein n=1 Tax=Pyrenophora seminiperda CCB06 TaxID=1302712 RepID=A0A3M7MI44_9PLEO|nr:hypothetical protein GMOD_00004943 [Pyrenophora seminiperda CCB06]